jgi:hypothetical protein
MQARVNQHRLEHAQWRVGFVRSLLDLHRHTLSLGGAEWIKEETVLVERLAAAENELQRLTGHEAD